MNAEPTRFDTSLAAEQVVRRLRDRGYVAYFAGGCVRDMLLGIEPADYDVATDAEPAAVRTIFSNTQGVGAAFGIILVRQGQTVIEVATFRTDGKYLDGRRPESIAFSNPAEDAKRRDFTINGMFYDPVDGKVIDYVGGRADLSSRTLRAIGDADQRFAEDQLRLLRAVRFAARFELSIDSLTAEAIARHAIALPRISPERIAGELRRMLMPSTRVAAVKLLRSLGLLRILFRLMPGEIAANGVVPAIGRASTGDISFGLALAALVLETRSIATDAELQHWLEPAGIRRATQAMRQSLKISNDELDDMAGAMDIGHLLDTEFPAWRRSNGFSRATSADAVRLLRALRDAGHFTERVDVLIDRFVHLSTLELAPPPLVTGDDLTTAGITPGPAFKRVLDDTYDEQLEGRFDSKAAALAFALAAMKSEPGRPLPGVS